MLTQPEIVLSLPESDVDDPELSIVIPAVDEALTIGDFVDWCKEGMAAAAVQGEMLIVDSSTDATARARSGARCSRVARPASAGSAGRTSTPCPTSAAATSSWAMPTAPTTSAGSSPSSWPSGRLRVRHGLSLAGQRSSQARCPRLTATSGRR